MEYVMLNNGGKMPMCNLLEGQIKNVVFLESLW